MRQVEAECENVGLELNARTADVMQIFTPPTPTHNCLTTIEGEELADVSNFKYHGSYMQSTEADLKSRKAVASKALNSMSTVWRSYISDSVRQNIFHATVEIVLLCIEDNCWGRFELECLSLMEIFSDIAPPCPTAATKTAAAARYTFQAVQ